MACRAESIGGALVIVILDRATLHAQACYHSMTLPPGKPGRSGHTGTRMAVKVTCMHCGVYLQCQDMWNQFLQHGMTPAFR